MWLSVPCPFGLCSLWAYYSLCNNLYPRGETVAYFMFLEVLPWKHKKKEAWKIKSSMLEALWASFMVVKNLPAMQETQVQSLGPEDPLEKGMATHSSILAWRIPWIEEPGRLQFMGSQRVRYNWATNTFTFQLRPKQTLWGVLELEWPFRVVPNWGKTARLLNL